MYNADPAAHAMLCYADPVCFWPARRQRHTHCGGGRIPLRSTPWHLAPRRSTHRCSALPAVMGPSIFLGWKTLVGVITLGWANLKEVLGFMHVCRVFWVSPSDSLLAGAVLVTGGLRVQVLCSEGRYACACFLRLEETHQFAIRVVLNCASDYHAKPSTPLAFTLKSKPIGSLP